MSFSTLADRQWSEGPLCANSRRSPTTLSLWATPVSPFRSLTRLKDSSVERDRDKCDLAVLLRRRPREQEAEVFAERPKPGDCKPHQRGPLKRKAKTECGLIGRDRIMSVVRRPLLDHDGSDGERHQLFERHTVVGIDVEQIRGDSREPEPLLHHVDGDEEDGRDILLRTTLLAQRLKCPKLVERMKRDAMHIFGKRVFFRRNFATGFADDARDRC